MENVIFNNYEVLSDKNGDIQIVLKDFMGEIIPFYSKKWKSKLSKPCNRESVYA